MDPRQNWRITADTSGYTHARDTGFIEAHIRRIGAVFLPETIVFIAAQHPAHTMRAMKTIVFSEAHARRIAPDFMPNCIVFIEAHSPAHVRILFMEGGPAHTTQLLLQNHCFHAGARPGAYGFPTCPPG